MSSPSDPQPPAAPPGSGQPSTKEIPVVKPGGATSMGRQLPAHPDATPPTPVPVDAPQPTGPVDLVPGLPGTGAPPVPQPTPAPPPPATPRQVAEAPEETPPTPAGPTWPDTLDGEEPGRGRGRGEGRVGTAHDRPALVAIGLVLISLVLLQLGLSLDFTGAAYWSTVPLWSAFATVCTVLCLAAGAAALPIAARLAPDRARRVATGALVGVAVFWLLVVLPIAGSDRGFLLTMALAALAGAVWTGSGRRA